MSIKLDDFVAGLPKRERAAIDARAKELIAEEMTLRDLRRARELTQVRLAETLGVGQESISRLEKRSDLLLSTLCSYVEAMGGQLRLVADFPDRPSVELTGVGGVVPPTRQG